MINQFFCLFIVIELDNYLSSKIILDYSNDKFDSDNLNLNYSNKQDNADSRLCDHKSMSRSESEIFEGNSHVSENDSKEIEWDESYQNLLTDEELRDIEINDLCKDILQVEEDLLEKINKDLTNNL